MTAHSAITGRTRLFARFDDVAAAIEDAPAAELFAVLQQMRAAVAAGAVDWSRYPELVDYARICFWAIRKLEYSFGAHAFAALEPVHQRPMRVLDVGCGVVPFCNWMSLRGHDVIAVDPNAPTIEFLQENDLNGFYGSQVQFRTASAEQLPFEDGVFDVVSCMSVLEHIPPGNDRLALWEMARVLKPGGHLIMTFDVAPVRELQDEDEPWPLDGRRFAHPFSPPAVRRLVGSIERQFEVTPDTLPAELDELTWGDVHAFWHASQSHDDRTEQTREYLALGLVLERSQVPVQVDAVLLHAAYQEGQAALAERLRYFERHAERRLFVIDDLAENASRLRSDGEEKEHLIAELTNAAEDRLRLVERLQEEVAQAHAPAPSPPQIVVAHEIDAKLAALSRETQRQAELLADIQERLGEMRESMGATRSPTVGSPEWELNQARRERDVAQATADARLIVIEEQRKRIEHYRRFRPRDVLSRWTAPRIGQLYQYPPRLMRLPPWYSQQRPPRNAPRLSLVTPSFNQGVFIERTVRSVLEQNYPRLEYIIQDGGSTDETLSALEPFADRLTSLESRPDGGFAHGLNLGFARTTGEIMAYVNSDDLFLPGALNYVAAYFNKHPEIDVVYSHRVIIDEYDAEIGRWVLPPHSDEVLSWADYVPQETLFWRRSLWERCGAAIDESFRFAIDWELLIRFRDAGARMARLPRFLGAFRVHPHQKTSSEMHEIGLLEMDRLRTRVHGRPVTEHEVAAALKPYLRQHFFYHKLYRLGVLRY